MDRGHELTEEMLRQLEAGISREFRQAAEEVAAKAQRYLDETELDRREQEARWKAGEITRGEYQQWCVRHTMMGQRWTDLRDNLAYDLHHAKDVAVGMAEGRMPDVYALNGNFAIYNIESGANINTGLALYNHDTAAYLLTGHRQLMPLPSDAKAAEIAANKDMQWNAQHIQSAVLQGVLQGENSYKVAQRLMQVGKMDENAAIRYARTMTTSAQNAGRYDAFHRATDLGIKLVIEWEAVMDDRTRHTHRMMHGERTTVDEPFETPDGYTIYYPADCSGESDAPQSEIWNCRCTLLAWVEGYEEATVTTGAGLDGMTFEEWQEGGSGRRAAPKVETPQTPAPAPKAPVGFVDGVKAIQERIAANGGVITEADLKEAGHLLSEEYAKEKDSIGYGRTANLDWLTGKLSQIRPVGSDGIDVKTHLSPSRSQAKKFIAEAYKHLPKSWVQASVDFGKLWSKTVDRGFYSHWSSTLAVSGWTDREKLECAIHELGHRMEAISSAILGAEKTFYDRRTSGIELTWLGSGYRRDETSRKDDFVDAYIGKDYGGKAYEVLSMGIEMAYMSPAHLAKDSDMQDFIYGILLLH